MSKIYIGIDPDIRLLNAAIVTDTGEARAVMVRKNNGGTGDAVVANAARKACRLIEDVIAFVVSDGEMANSEIVLIIESQSMMHTKRMREKGKKVDYEDIRRLAQVTGCLLGAFSNISSSIHLVQPSEWKKTLPKGIHHGRIYKALGIPFNMMGGASPYAVPTDRTSLTAWSKDKINPGDFKDITDSLGLALYGVKHRF